MKYKLIVLIFTLISNSVFGQSYCDLANKYMGQKHEINEISEFKRLIKTADLILENDPENLDVLFCKGLLLDYKKEYKKAVETYSKILQMDSTHSEAYYNIAGIKLNQFSDLRFYSKYSDDTFNNKNAYWDCEGDQAECIELAKQILPLLKMSVKFNRSSVEEDIQFFKEMSDSLSEYLKK